MKAGMEIVVRENLKSLKLSTMVSHLESTVRQAKESHHSYEEFLLNLTDLELQVRGENSP